ncbi:MAG: type IIA DNA topoisomerase subunit B [Bacteroides sp.]|nr:type IIA DNA topoisomerase subunit B [Bacteroides sp.]MCM1379957.1 type IIA DNA topoisomerase subunit B [Bacteroides sp.]MCM1446288.1 type IIA DNA topoisomerase subunit B [Prevotella sp.]
MSEEQNLLSEEELGYSGDDIRTLDWKEHIRRRPGMYIGKLGDGSANDDGIYVLLKEVLDNSIDEFMMGFGKQITVDISEDRTVTVRDFGRGIPLEKLEDASSKMNTGAKYDSKAFKKSVGLNGVGIKAVNALSVSFVITASRGGQSRTIEFERGNIVSDTGIINTSDEPNGTRVCFTPDAEIFRGFHYVEQHVMPLLKNYTYLNTGLAIIFNGRRYSSRNGLADLLKEKMDNDPLYPPIHLKGDDIEVVITHAEQYGEEYYSFVNGQHTTQGGTHLAAYKDAVGRTIKEFYGKDFLPADIRNGMVAAVSIKVEEPVFESQTKTKLGSRDVGPEGPTVAKFISDFLKKELDNYLHKDKDTAEILLNKIQASERDRKAMATVTKAARERAKKTSLNNPKLRDCQIHFNDAKVNEELRNDSCIFITEGDSASGSITKIRNVKTQAVFSLRGKPLNSYGKTLKVVYENDEFNLLQAALNIEDGIDGLRYNKVIIATDADVDGMHIRLLLMTFFLQYFPDLVKKGHVYILQTPLFRVRSKKGAKRGAKKSSGEKAETYYCYTDQERIDAIERLKSDAEITRFKGLGEISPDEFAGFIGPDMRLDQVSVSKEDGVNSLLAYYMGKNTPERQQFIIQNLVIEDDSQIS